MSWGQENLEIQFHAQTKNRVDALLNNIDSEENASLLE